MEGRYGLFNGYVIDVGFLTQKWIYSRKYTSPWHRLLPVVAALKWMKMMSRLAVMRRIVNSECGSHYFMVRAFSEKDEVQ